jgi:hypothetical protein
MSKFTIGCDPEFIMREKRSGNLISAIPHVRGTKHNPMPLPLGGNIQRDNVAVEIATDPTDSAAGFVGNIKATLSEAIKTLPEEVELIAEVSAHFPEDQLQHPEAEAFGCDPDYCAWECAENEKPCPVGENYTFRSFGAHIHVGTTGKDENTFLLDFNGKIDMVKAMDCFHGIISTVLDSGEKSIARRKLYGKPGAHRPKDYGVEYRVLSNYWLKSPVTVMLMYNLTSDALDQVREGIISQLIEEIGKDNIHNTIMNGDIKAAMEIIDKHLMKRMSQDSIHYYNEAVAKLRANDMDFHKEWELYHHRKES